MNAKKRRVLNEQAKVLLDQAVPQRGETPVRALGATFLAAQYTIMLLKADFEHSKERQEKS